MDAKNLEDWNVELLPSGGIKLKLYRYRGFAFTELVLPRVLADFPDFELRKDDVLVSSFPKSGTTWLQEIVYMLCHNLEESNDQSDTLGIRFPYLDSPHPSAKPLESVEGRRLMQTHVPFHMLPRNFVESGAKLIYIERNPRDLVVSMYYYYCWKTEYSFTGTFEEFVYLFIDNLVICTPFFAHLKSYRESKSENVLIVSYEGMKKSPEEVIKRIAAFLEIPLNDEEAKCVAAATSFSSMSKNTSVNYSHWIDEGEANKDRGTFMRKGEVGDWENHFTDELLEIFEKWEQENGSILDTAKS